MFWRRSVTGLYNFSRQRCAIIAREAGSTGRRRAVTRRGGHATAPILRRFARAGSFLRPTAFRNGRGGDGFHWNHCRSGAEREFRAACSFGMGRGAALEWELLYPLPSGESFKAAIGRPPTSRSQRSNEKGRPRRDRPFSCRPTEKRQAALGSAAFAWAMMAVKTAPSFIARSAMTLRSSSMPASFTPCMNCE
jgi:hypothetical protein